MPLTGTIASAISLGPLTASSQYPSPTYLSSHQNLPCPHPVTDYGDTPQCHRIDSPPMTSLSPTSCELASQIICQRFASQTTTQLVRDRWIWTEVPGCAVAYWLPEDALVPDPVACQVRNIGAILEKWAYGSRDNAGTINVDNLPDFGKDERPIVEHMMMYLMTPERLTL